MRIDCRKCGQKLDLTRSKLEVKLICKNPVFSRIDVTCCHCGECQTFSVMDQEQMDTLKKYFSLLRSIEFGKQHGWRHSRIVKLQLECEELMDYMMDRAPMLMEKYEISQWLAERAIKRGVNNNNNAKK